MGTMIDAGCRRRYRSTKSGKLFFCFNSRFFSSSSSMNISSRSILSPARHRDHPLSLSASLSRRLRSDGSLKGGQSPMFPTSTTNASKKRTAGALENPEPSSPKVTCIGQVRVKSKKKKNNNNNKHGRKLRNPSRRRSGGDGSFRRTDNWGSVDLSSTQTNIPENRHRNQRWVHLPLTICEGLKGLGAEISCLLPCGSSSCFSSSSERGGSKRERSIIRSNLEEMEISSCREKLEGNKLDSSDEDEDEDEDEGRVVTVCVPPKNALLLMRCRSDPMKMTALSRRLLESPVLNGDERGEDNNVDNDADFEDPESEWCSPANANLITTVLGLRGEEEAVEEVERFDVDESGMDEEFEEESEQGREELQEEKEDCKRGSRMEEEEDSQRGSTTEEEEDIKRDSTTMEEEEEEDIKRGSTVEEEGDSTMVEEEEDIERGSTMVVEEEENEMNEIYLSFSGKEDDQKLIGEEKNEEEGESVAVLSDSESELKCEDLAIESSIEMENVEEKAANEDDEEEEEESLISGLWPEDDPAQSEREMPSPSPSPTPLPDCLLLMMGEPKVSMEVSKETWVCTTDFMRFLPERRRRPASKALADVDEPEKKVGTSTVSNTNNTSRPKPELKQAQPPRSSCSIPGKAAPVLTAQKLPRCKSEPMRTAAAKLVPPETCMWKSRKVEPLSRATVGVGSAAGVGF